MRTNFIIKIGIFCLGLFSTLVINAQEILRNGSFEDIDTACLEELNININGEAFFIEGCVSPWEYGGGHLGPVLINNLNNSIWLTRNVDPVIPDGDYLTFLYSDINGFVHPTILFPCALSYFNLNAKAGEVYDFSFNIHSVENNKIIVIASDVLNVSYEFEDPSTYATTQVIYSGIVNNADQWQQIAVEGISLCHDYNYLTIYSVFESIDDDLGSILRGVLVDNFSMIRQPEVAEIVCAAEFNITYPTANNCFFTFNNNSENPSNFPASYEWDFGDGTSSNEESPGHVFDVAGEYKVCLTQTLTLPNNTDCGGKCINTICKSINSICESDDFVIGIIPIRCSLIDETLSDEINPPNACRFCFTSFIYTSGSATVEKIVWISPAGGTTGPSVTFVIPESSEPGTKKVCLRVTLSNGQSKIVCIDVSCRENFTDPGGESSLEGSTPIIMTQTERTSSVDFSIRENKMTLYPIPFSSRLRINSIAENAELTIIDITGKMRFQKTIASGQLDVDTDTWAAGIYFVRLINANGLLQQEKIIKQ